jgi:hypothetical protein
MAKGDVYTIVGNGGSGFGIDGVPPTQTPLGNTLSPIIDSAGNLLFSDAGAVRMVAAANCPIGSCPYGYSQAMTKGDIYAIAGTGIPGDGGDGGPATSAQIDQGAGIAIDADGDLVVVESSGARVRLIAASPCAAGECPFGYAGAMATGDIYTIAGDGVPNFAGPGDGGPATSAEFFSPIGVAIDSQGDLLVSDTLINRVRMVAGSTCAMGTCPLGYPGAMTAGNIYTVAGDPTATMLGDGGPATSAHLTFPLGLAFDPDGNLLIADVQDNRIRSVVGTLAVPAAPTVTGVSVPCGPVGSGTPVTVTGTHLQAASEVDFGAAAVTSGIRMTDRGHTLAVTSPAGSGTVDVTVTTAGGTSATSSADQLTYGPGRSCDAPVGTGTKPQSITIGARTPTGSPVGSSATLGATGGGSGNAVTFAVDPTSDPGVCKVTGNTVTYLAVGTCVLDANQVGDATYAPAPQVTESITVVPAGTVGVTDPTITAAVSDRGRKLHHGWYRSPVTITFHCTLGSSALTAACPKPVVLRHSGKALSVAKTITATDGGTATVTVSKINLDRTKPTVRVTGARNRGVYRHKQRLRCHATDALSGVESCRITQHQHLHGTVTTITWTATATDLADNQRRSHGSYQIKVG